MDEVMNDINNSDLARKTMAVESRAELAFTQALWYAWGRVDSGEYRTRRVADKIDVFKFAHSVKSNQRAFDTEGTHFNESIQGQWDKYIDSLTEAV